MNANNQSSSSSNSVRPQFYRRNRSRRGAPIENTSVPLASRYIISNNSPDSKCMERGFEFIGSMTLTQNTPANTVYRFDMNPLSYPNTRLSNLANSFQKYKFRKMELMLQNNFSTGTSGNVIVAYSENPDYQVQQGSQLAQNQAFALAGSKSANFWQPVAIEARFSERTRWYNVDADSNQTMNTTQGAFYIVLQNPPNTTTPQTIPIMLRYDIEFSGASFSTQAVNQTQYSAPEGTLNFNVSGTQVYARWTPSTGFSLPPAPSNALYACTPSLEIGDNQAKCLYIVDSGSATWLTTSNVYFYASSDLFNPQAPAENALSVSSNALPVEFTTIYPIPF